MDNHSIRKAQSHKSIVITRNTWASVQNFSINLLGFAKENQSLVYEVTA
jgi:hypothetical protein